jgi:hypothetical protein
MVLSELTSSRSLCTQNSIFHCKSTFIPRVDVEPKEEEEEQKDGGIVLTQPLSNYLPGERLLQKFNKGKKKAKKKKPRANNLSVDDVDVIAKKMVNIMRQLS